MNNIFLFNKVNTKKCQVCERDIPESANYCECCGWVQHARPLDPDTQYWDHNFVTLNKARRLYAMGKPIQPDFADFLKCMQVYAELEFYCRGKHYGLLHTSDDSWHFYEWNVMDIGYQIYGAVEEFAQKANIEGVLLKDIWNEVYDVGLAS